MYAGLTIDDEAALLEAKKNHAQWIAKDSDERTFSYLYKPRKGSSKWDDSAAVTFIGHRDPQFVSWSDPEPVNIDAALAQIAEMKAAQTPVLPPTWNDAINAMSAEEKAKNQLGRMAQMHNEAARYAWDCFLKDGADFEEKYIERMTELLNSPYDGAKAEEGAER